MANTATTKKKSESRPSKGRNGTSERNSRGNISIVSIIKTTTTFGLGFKASYQFLTLKNPKLPINFQPQKTQMNPYFYQSNKQWMKSDNLSSSLSQKQKYTDNTILKPFCKRQKALKNKSKQTTISVKNRNCQSPTLQRTNPITDHKNSLPKEYNKIYIRLDIKLQKMYHLQQEVYLSAAVNLKDFVSVVEKQPQIFLIDQKSMLSSQKIYMIFFLWTQQQFITQKESKNQNIFFRNN